MASGIKVAQDAIDIYNKLQKDHAHRYVILKFNDKRTEVVHAYTGSKDATFDDFLQDMSNLRGRAAYIAYDFEYQLLNGQTRQKVLLVNWSSDDECVFKEKMLVSSTAKEVGLKCQKFSKHVTINDWDDLNEENMINIVSENRTK